MKKEMKTEKEKEIIKEYEKRRPWKREGQRDQEWKEERKKEKKSENKKQKKNLSKKIKRGSSFSLLLCYCTLRSIFKQWSYLYGTNLDSNVFCVASLKFSFKFNSSGSVNLGGILQKEILLTVDWWNFMTIGEVILLKTNDNSWKYDDGNYKMMMMVMMILTATLMLMMTTMIWWSCAYGDNDDGDENNNDSFFRLNTFEEKIHEWPFTCMQIKTTCV